MRLIAIVLILIAPSWAAAGRYDETVKLSDISPIFIKILDSSVNGCWTNIMEAKKYAADQIDMAGGTVGDPFFVYQSSFLIAVNGERMPNGSCYGSWKVKFNKISYFRDVKVQIVYSEKGRIGVSNTNFNIPILDIIKDHVAEWKN